MCHRTCIRRDVAQLKLEGKRQKERGRQGGRGRESGDMATVMDGCGVDLLL